MTFLIDFTMLWLFTSVFHVFYLISNIFSSLISGTFNYVVSTLWVFHQKKTEHLLLDVTVFTLIGGVGLGLNTFILWVFTHFVHLYYLISKIISTTVVYTFNFFVRKYTIYDKDKLKVLFLKKMQS